MNLPTLVDYRDAVQNPQSAFQDHLLRSGRPRSNQQGLPAVASGGFALTFKIDVRSDCYAVRCFHKEGNRLHQRYAHIADFVRRNPGMSFLADVDYLPAGIRVQGADHPIVRMAWVDGVPLGDWAENHLHEPAKIGVVRERIGTAVVELHRAGVAHGDLQHGNILVDSDQNVRFVDYDGMFLPSLSELGAAERGHRNYQHPARGERYDTSIDLFAASVIDLSLMGLQHSPELWEEFNTGENLLLSASDFHDPAGSQVFSRLGRISATADKARTLARACEVDFDAVPGVLRGASSASQRPTGRRRPASPYEPKPVPGHDADALRNLEGEVVTVFGKVTSARAHPPGNANINFGDYRRGDFTIAAFGKASRDLKKQHGDLRSLNGSWVSVTGLVTLYYSPKWGPTPQIELYYLNAFRELTGEQIEKLHAAANAPEEPLAAQPVAEQRTTNTPADIDTKLGKLYTSSTFARHVTPTAQTTQGDSTPPAQGPTDQPPRSELSPRSNNPSPPSAQPKHQSFQPNPRSGQNAPTDNNTTRPPNEPGRVPPNHATYYPQQNPPPAPRPPQPRPRHNQSPPSQQPEKTSLSKLVRRWFGR